MDFSTKNPKSATPVKDSHGRQPRFHEISRSSENLNPNLSSRSSPGPKPSNSPLTKSAKSQKSASKIANQNPVVYSPRKKIRERKFVVAKKNSKKEKGNLNSNVDCKCQEKFGGNVKKCLCVAYETLRASQEEFFKNREEKERSDEETVCDGEEEENPEIGDGCGSDCQNMDEIEESSKTGNSTTKRRRERLLEEARNSVPESGKVMYLVKAFEQILSLPNSKGSDKKEDEKEELEESKKKAMQWALPGLHSPKATDTEAPSSLSFTVDKEQESLTSFCPSDLFLTSENLGLDPRFSVSSSWDSSQGSITCRTSNGGRRSRRNVSPLRP